MIGDHSITGGGVCGDGKGVSGIQAPDRESGVAGTVGRRFGALHGPGDGGDAISCLIGPIGASKLIGEMSNGE